MSKILVTLLFGLLIPLLHAENPTERELETVEIVAKIIHSDPIWPGYQLNKSPILITFSDGHIFAFNLISESSFWHNLKLSDYSVKYSEIDHWDIGKNPMQMNFKIENQSAFLLQIDLMKGDETLPFLVMIHERFHKHQYETFNFKSNRLGPYEDHLNGENLILMQLEENILIDYFKTNDLEKIKDFVAVNQERQSMMSPSSIEHELEQQKLEGLADYASIKLLDETSIVPFDGKKRLQEVLEGYQRNENIAERAMKWRHYGVGAAIGYTLDDLKVIGWKEEVQEQGVSPLIILSRTLSLSKQETVERLNRLKVEYHYDQIKIETEVKLQAYRNKLKTLLEDHESQPGLFLTVRQLRHSGQTGGGTSKGIIYMPDGSTILMMDNSTASSTDNAWKLKLKTVPYVFQGSKGEKSFKAEENLLVYIDDQPFRIEDLVKLGDRSFNKIVWKGEKTEFECVDRPGFLRIFNDRIVLSF